ncbi:MAG: hypothetical protein CMJ49_10710 [Planctomycetaceae bacterium]|nr:hypothetical protein [Planctomycetaceae bacterium]
MRIYEADADPRTLAETQGLSLLELAQSAADPAMRRALHGLRLLADLQAQLLVSRYRVMAAARLVALANTEDGGEVARKACVDLLKLNLIDGDVGKPTDDDQPGIPTVDPQQVLAMLEQVGRE